MKKIIIRDYLLNTVLLFAILAIFILCNLIQTGEIESSHLAWRSSQAMAALVLLWVILFNSFKEQIRWIKIFEDKIQIKIIKNFKPQIFEIQKNDIKKFELSIIEDYKRINLKLDIKLLTDEINIKHKFATPIIIEQISQIKNFVNFTYDIYLDSMPKSKKVIKEILDGNSKVLLHQKIYTYIISVAIIFIIILLFIS